MKTRWLVVVLAALATVAVVVVRNRGPGSTPGVGAGAVATTADQIARSRGTTTTADTHPVPPTSSAPTTTSSAADVTDGLETVQPLVHVLPHDTTHYRIDYQVEPGGRLALTLTLLAVLNHEYQRATYTAQLRQYKAEALEFLRGHGVDAATYSVTYEPPEAAAL